MKWPLKVRHRKNGPVLAKIYRPGKGRDSYRVAWRGAGRRMMQSFARFAGQGGAREFAELKVRELAQGSLASALTPAEARGAVAVRDALDTFRRDTGRTITAAQAITEYLAAVRQLGERPLSEAVAGFLGTVATVKRVDLAVAVEEFLAGMEVKTKAREGLRPQLAARYVYLCGRLLRPIAKEFTGYALCDLTKEHLDLFMGHQQRADLGPKTRNHYRATLKMFIRWAARKDYLPASHRLLEAPGMERETVMGGDSDFYRPAELRRLLDAANETLRPLLVLGGLAGLRQKEALRLTWADVFRVPGHIEVTAMNAKTRSRRLVAMEPAVAKWLQPYRPCEGAVWPQGEDALQEAFLALRESLGIPPRRNGLRHAFCTFHFALHANENLTAQQAGNSPGQIHAHYKGLATKKEAAAWFAVKPAKAAPNIVPMVREGGA